MEIVGGRRLELWHQVDVEVLGLLGLGVEEQAPTADLLAQLEGPGDHVLQQPRAEASPLVVDVDSEACEQGDRLGVSPDPLAGRCAPLRP